MDNSLWIAVSCVVFLLVGKQYVVATTLDSRAFSEELNRLASEDMGITRMQEHLNTEVHFEDSPLDSKDLIIQLSQSLTSKFHERIQVVKQLRDTIQAQYLDMAPSSSMPLCCDVNNGEFDTRFKTEVNHQQACIVGKDPGERLNNAVLEEMKSLLQDWPTIKWSYFGSETGTMTIYPASHNCARQFDNRYRPWYVETATPTPKDLVLVIDRSGSMQQTYGARTRLSVAQEAASTVINGLNPNDRVNIVAFSDTQEKPPGDINIGTCFSDKLALATPRNKKYLNEYLRGITATGGTLYAPALQNAFQLLANTPESNGKRDKVILFLSDGEPQDANLAKQTLRDENAAMGNRVIILTYGMGSDFSSGSMGRQILEDLAKQTNHKETAGEVLAGTFTPVTDLDKLREVMGTYYSFFSRSGGQLSTSIISTPYIDNFGLGLVTSVCLPVHQADSLVGVTCVDITMDDLLTDVTYFQPGKHSYAMIADGNGRTMMHPLLPRPYEVTEDPIFVHIDQLERCSGIDQVLEGMLSGISGDARLRCSRVTARGDTLHEGVDVMDVTATYFWQPISDTNFSVCVVLADGDKQARISDPSIWPTNFFYHNLPLQASLPKCSAFTRVAIKDGSTVKLSPIAFNSPTRYLETRETMNDYNRYKNYMTGISGNNPGLKEGIRATVAATLKADTIWKSRGEITHVAWRYLGTENGVFRLYPGTRLEANYDHTQRPWYKRTIGQKGLLTLSVPYLDAFGAGVVISLCQTLTETSSDRDAMGVMAMDFTMHHFYQTLEKLYPVCTKIGNRCFVMDNTGYLVVHKDFIDYEPGKAPEYIHITEKEPQVARDLINGGYMKEEECTNFQKIRQQHYWRVDVGINGATTSTAELHQVQGSNIILGIVLSNNNSPWGCQCMKSQGDTGKCPTEECRCPCYMSVNYDTCKNRFIFTANEGSYSCPPQAPPLPINRTAIDLEKAEIYSLELCFDYNCQEKDSLESCEAVVACTWCYDSGTSSCTDKIKCLNGDLSSGKGGKNGNSGGDDGSKGTIIGIVVALLVLIIIIIVIVVIVIKRKKQSAGQPNAQRSGHDNFAMGGSERPPPSAPDYHGSYLTNESPPPYPGV